MKHIVVALMCAALIVPSDVQGKPPPPPRPPCQAITPTQDMDGVYRAEVVEVMDDGRLDPYAGPGTSLYTSSPVRFVARYDDADTGMVSLGSAYVMGYFSSPVRFAAPVPFTLYACLGSAWHPGRAYLPLAQAAP